MRVHVRLFGPLRVVVGSGEIELALSGESATVAQALDALIARYPLARRYLRDPAGEMPPGLRALMGDVRLMTPQRSRRDCATAMASHCSCPSSEDRREAARIATGLRVSG